MVPVAHMDEVLRAALALPLPGEFLKEPSVPVDWRIAVERRGPPERREGGMPVASAVPPPGVPAEAPNAPAAQTAPRR
jgi:hypothetical protein